MNDLISRQEAIDALHMNLMYRMGTDSNKKRLDDLINGVPSAEPKKGKWDMSHASVYIKCSVCGEPFMMMPQNYCPNCGAKMEAGHE